MNFQVVSGESHPEGITAYEWMKLSRQEKLYWKRARDPKYIAIRRKWELSKKKKCRYKNCKNKVCYNSTWCRKHMRSEAAKKLRIRKMEEEYDY